MNDMLYWDFHEKLSIELDREATYEEVQERIKQEFTITKEQELEYQQEKIYGIN